MVARRVARADVRAIRTLGALKRRNPAGRGGYYRRLGLVALAGFVAGVAILRSRRSEPEPEFSFGSGRHPAPESSGAERWGTGVPVGEQPSQTGAGRSYSDPREGPLVGEESRPRAETATGRDESVEQRIRTRLGEDPRTAAMARVNVEFNEGVAELRGEASSEETREAAGEITAATEGVREVRNLITVNPEAPTRQKGGEESGRSS